MFIKKRVSKKLFERSIGIRIGRMVLDLPLAKSTSKCFQSYLDTVIRQDK